MSRRRTITLLVFVALSALSFSLHVWRGATASDFGAHNDEPAHVVTGLMVRDYATSFAPEHPIAFAKDFYVHYPKVGIGHWPPVFYVIQAAWTALFGSTIASYLVLMSVLTGLVGTTIHVAVRSWAGLRIGVAAATLFTVAPIVQEYGSMVMTEIPLTLFCTCSAMQFGLFVDRGRPRHAIGFALFAIAAIMTKGNALSLGLLPPIALILAGRLDLLRQPALWVAAAVIGVATGPWYFYSLEISATTWEGGVSMWDYAERAIPFYSLGVLTVVGLGIGLLGLLGAVLRPPARRRGVWASMVAMTLSWGIFHTVVPSSVEARHLVLVAPAWLYLAAWGARSLLAPSTLPRRLAVAALALVPFLVWTFDVPPKDYRGFSDATHALLESEDFDAAIFVIASDAQGEGMFVSSLALADTQVRHTALRATKVLAQSDWMGRDYEQLFETPETLTDYLRSVPVAAVVIDHSVPDDKWFPHAELLDRTMKSDPAWELWRTFDVVRAGERFSAALTIYRQIEHGRLPRTELRFEDVSGTRFGN